MYILYEILRNSIIFVVNIAGYDSFHYAIKNFRIIIILSKECQYFKVLRQACKATPRFCIAMLCVKPLFLFRLITGYIRISFGAKDLDRARADGLPVLIP